MFFFFFFFKQKTAYEMRISDWSSDVCSSDSGIVLGVEIENEGRADEIAQAHRPAIGHRQRDVGNVCAGVEGHQASPMIFCQQERTSCRVASSVATTASQETGRAHV